MFHLVHRMEGRWSGHVSTVSSSGNHATAMETLTSTSLSFVGGGGGDESDQPSHWREDTWLTAPNGVTRRTTLRW